MDKKRYLILFCLLILYSCTDKSIKPENTPSFLGEILNKQQELLNNKNPKVFKISIFNGKADSTLTDAIKWEQELGVFRRIDIFKMSGKPILLKIQDKNCFKYIETSTKGIDSLFVYGDQLTNPDSILAFGSANNFFFVSRSTYSLTFDSITRNLKKYRLLSNKVFVWGKTDSFSMSATIEN